MDSRYSGFLEANPTFQDRVEAFTSGLLTPDPNAYIESFNRRFRDELLNAEVFGNLREAQVLVEDYRRRYNRPRPHSSLDYATPAAFAAACLAAAPVGPAPTPNRRATSGFFGPTVRLRVRNRRHPKFFFRNR